MGRAYQNKKLDIAKTSDAKAKVYSKYGREIYVCAKSGGVEPDGNLALRSLIDKAKKDQVPSHVIDKALEKAKGGPGNAMVIVECLTDNPNRTFGDVRLCFTKTKCKIGTSGSVGHMFDHSAIFVFAGDDEDAVLEALMEADVDVTDVECEDGKTTVFAPNTEYNNTKQALIDTLGNDKGEFEFEVDEIQFIPQNTNPVTGDDAAMFETFLDMLTDLDDVQNVYHNAEID